MSWGEKSCKFHDVEEKPCTPMIETCNVKCPYYEQANPFLLLRTTAGELKRGEIVLIPKADRMNHAIDLLIADKMSQLHVDFKIKEPVEKVDLIKEIIKICGWIVEHPKDFNSTKVYVRKVKSLQTNKKILSQFDKVITTSKVVEISK